MPGYILGLNRVCNRTRLEEDISRILFKQQSILSACRHAALCDLPPASNGPFSCGCIFGLAPGGVCHAACLAAGRGELLPRHFTLTPRLRSGRRPGCPLRLGAMPRAEPRGGIFSVALSIASRRPGVTRHPALRCSDFPHRPSADRPVLLPGPLRFTR